MRKEKRQHRDTQNTDTSKNLEMNSNLWLWDTFEVSLQNMTLKTRKHT